MAGHPPVDVAIVGAGIIGSAIAWRCVQRGLSVAIADPDPSRGAWNTAAGMLAPVTELHYAESALLRLNLASAARWPAFAAELSDASGVGTGLRETGTIEAAWDFADLAALRDLHAFGATLGLSSRLLTGTELRDLEPALAPGLPGGLLAEYDHQVDPRRVHRALTAALTAAGVTVLPLDAVPTVSGVRATGMTLAGDSAVPAGVVVLAAGAWSGRLAADVPVRPVKGQTLRLRSASAPLQRVVRATVQGSEVYVVPRADGEIVVGASSEEAGFDQQPRAGAVYELLRDAQSVLPELGEATLVEMSTGLRPGTADNAPLLGPSGVDGLVLATGHYRNGVLLTPITADGIAAYIADGVLPDELVPFGADRRAEALR